MTVWILIFYMSSGVSSIATGGPAVIDGFTSQEACMDAGNKISKVKKYDWHECLEVKK